VLKARPVWLEARELTLPVYFKPKMEDASQPPTTVGAEDGDVNPPQIDDPLSNGASAQVHLPRITIRYCTQCNWMLKAAYFAQELLSTFSTSLGEVALIPATGGVFTVSILHPSNVAFSAQETALWDRKTDGGFPEMKQLKALVRDIVDPSRDLGHVDRALAKQIQGMSLSDQGLTPSATEARSTEAARAEEGDVRGKSL
jgi:selT/selW/selH-like putative selenoprotein